MKISKKGLYIGLAVLLALIISAVVYFKNHGTESNAEPQTNTLPQAAGHQAGQATNGSFWEGKLQASNNKTKGNLMLKTATSTIYINTSRDFSDLMGKQVQVTYQGTANSFQLGDITAQ